MYYIQFDFERLTTHLGGNRIPIFRSNTARPPRALPPAFPLNRHPMLLRIRKLVRLQHPKRLVNGHSALRCRLLDLDPWNGREPVGLAA